jgi:hypothetical protein
VERADFLASPLLKFYIRTVLMLCPQKYRS